MNPNLMHQELARIRYAEVLREAGRRHAVVRDEPEREVAEPVLPRRRLLFSLRPALRPV